jgi:hypothetical protein
VGARESSSLTRCDEVFGEPEWHYIVHEKLDPEVYDWKNDPREMHNLANAPEMRSEVARLSAYLPGWSLEPR